jgi:hypothetical protein
MKPLYCILLSLISIISCQSSNKIEGIWIGAYQIHYHDGKPIFLSSMRLLLDISKDEIAIKTFNYPMYEEKDSTITHKYHIDKNYLIINSDTFIIKGVTGDSLILGIQSDYDSDYVFKRLSQTNKKNKINFQNKAFSLAGHNYSDSIDFINDSLILHIGNKFNTNNSYTNWSINSYKSFDFLVLNQFESPPFLIDKSSAKNVSLKLFSTKILEFEMTLLENINDTNGLIGNWVQFAAIPSPYHIQDKKDADIRKHLRITKDNIEIKQINRTHIRKWKINSTNHFIYFPENNMTNFEVWKILEISDNKLVIEVNRRGFHNANSEIMEFEKIINVR